MPDLDRNTDPAGEQQPASLALTAERLGHEVDRLRHRLGAPSVGARLFGAAGEGRRQAMGAELLMVAAVLAHVADRLSIAEAAAALAERHRRPHAPALVSPTDLDLFPVEVAHA